MQNGENILKKPLSILLLLCVFNLITAKIAFSQQKPLLVAIELLAPFVMVSDG
jgi:hypothetical protein